MEVAIIDPYFPHLVLSPPLHIRIEPSRDEGCGGGREDGPTKEARRVSEGRSTAGSRM